MRTIGAAKGSASLVRSRTCFKGENGTLARKRNVSQRLLIFKLNLVISKPSLREGISFRSLKRQQVN